MHMGDKMEQHNIILNKHNLILILDKEKEHWFLLFPKYGQYASGSFNDNGLERIHHPIRVGTRQYALVLDCNDDGTEWESFSFWDEKKQLYIDTAQGKIN
jgi:hypothetical protein